MVIGLFGGHIEDSQAGTAVSLRESYAGNLSFELTGGSFRTTQNNTSACQLASSSSGNLTTLPVNADIKKAYLYWAASGDGFNVDNTVTLNGITIVADRMYTEDTGSWDFFNGVADVTNIINSQRNGIYTLSDLSIYSTFNHCQSQTTLGGWALAIIYEDDSVPFHVLNLYEGFQSYQNSTVTLIPDNFKLPSTPSGKHAHITWEGDDTLGTDGEYLAFEGVRLTDAGNPSNNQFNSYSNVQGGFTSYGVDIDEYDISPYLTAGAESVTTVYSAGQDLVLLSAELVSVANIPVADLSVTTSDPSAWTQGTQVTKKFTISNNGPNDVPTQSVRFSTTLPTQLSLASLPNDSDWQCNQSGQTLTCIYQNKLRSGWSDYLDITFDVANGTAGSTVNWNVTVDHDLAPYDIFDNHAENDTKNLSVPISFVPVVDLSASSKTYTNLSGDSLLAGDTLRYVITIDDASDLVSNNIRVLDQLPGNISGFSILSLPAGATNNSTTTGGTNGTGVLDISNISLGAGQTEQIVFEVTIDANAPKGASLQNQASLTEDSSSWVVDTGDITVVEPDLTPSTISTLDVNGGLLKAGDTIRVTMTLDDLYDLDISNLRVSGDMPNWVTSLIETALPSGATSYSNSNGGGNGTGLIDIRTISFSAGNTATVSFEVTIDPSAQNGDTIQFNQQIVLNSKVWSLQSDVLTVQNNSPAASGNKQLYMNTNNSLTRLIPSDGTLTIVDENFIELELSPALQDDLTFSITDVTIEMYLEGNRYFNNGNPRTTTPDITVSLFTSTYTLLAQTQFNSVTLRPGTIEPISDTLTKNGSISNDSVTITQGDTLKLRIATQDGNGSSQSNRNVTLHIFDTLDDTQKANGYSAVILNASTVINVDSVSVWTQAFNDTNGDFLDDSGAIQVSSHQPDTSLSVRASVSDPFGAFDIGSVSIEIKKADGSLYDFSGVDAMTAIDDPSDDTQSSSKQFEKLFSLSEENEKIGNWTITIRADEGTEGDVQHTEIGTFTVAPFLPQIGLTKNVSVISDPVNGTSNPKAIPGAELMYTINGINTGRGKSDSNTIKMTDEIPANAELYIGDVTCNNRGPGTGLGPVCFIDGTTPHESGLSYNFITLDNLTDGVQFSTDGNDFTYEPDLTNGDYDAAIRFIRIEPTGTYNNQPKDGSKQPEFTFSYRVRLN